MLIRLAVIAYKIISLLVTQLLY